MEASPIDTLANAIAHINSVDSASNDASDKSRIMEFGNTDENDDYLFPGAGSDSTGSAPNTASVSDSTSSANEVSFVENEGAFPEFDTSNDTFSFGEPTVLNSVLVNAPKNEACAPTE